MNFLKNLFKSSPKYKIKKYPTKSGDSQYAAFYEDWGVWWSIDKNGVSGVAEDSIMKYGPFFDTYEEAGAAVNKHATNGGSETVWMG